MNRETAAASSAAIDWREIDRLVARAEAERSKCIGAWIRRVVLSWMSVFKGPGHILPRDPGGSLSPR